MKHIPNILTFIRIAMVGFFIYAFAKANYILCLSVYVAAFITDVLDGYIARKHGWITDAGKLLDPLADKLMLIAAMCCFFARGWLPVYMFVIVVAIEAVMIFGAYFLYKRNVVVYADWFGKSATGMFAIGIVLTLCKEYIPKIQNYNLYALALALTLCIVAFAHYVRRNVVPQMKKADRT